MDFRHTRFTYTINNPRNPRPVNVRIGADQHQLKNQVAMKNGDGIILTKQDGMVPTIKMDKKGELD